MSAVGAGLVMMELSRIDFSIADLLCRASWVSRCNRSTCSAPRSKGARYLPPMARFEKVGAFALTEPDHGSDSVALETTARREGNEWVINGRKRWPGNAVWCDYIVVYARDVADKQVKAFVVEKDNPGYKATKIEGKVSLRMVQNADIMLTDCRVSEDARLQNCNSFKDCAKVLMGTRNRLPGRRSATQSRPTTSPLNYAQRQHPIRQADRQVPDDPIDVGQYARRCYRDAALLHPTRPPDR